MINLTETTANSSSMFMLQPNTPLKRRFWLVDCHRYLLLEPIKWFAHTNYFTPIFWWVFPRVISSRRNQPWVSDDVLCCANSFFLRCSNWYSFTTKFGNLNKNKNSSISTKSWRIQQSADKLHDFSCVVYVCLWTSVMSNVQNQEQ